MDFNGQIACLALVTISMALVTMPTTAEANRAFFSGGNYSQPQPKKVIVGGDQHWQFGFNYFEWAFKAAPFFENDTLVFKYDPPSNQTFPHSVYQFKDFRSFMACNLRKAQLVASPMQGGGNGFELVLKRRMMPYMFACGERAGFHCKVGKMKFVIMPCPRPPFNP